MGEWADIPLNAKLFLNVDENMLTSTYGALENCFVTESNGLSRFPGLKPFVTLGGNAEIHMGKFNNDMIAVGTDGQTYRVSSEGEYKQIDGPPVLGGGRTSFARTRDGLMMAAGQQIIKYDGNLNSVLSDDAPLSSFVGFVDGYLLAVEKNSGRFQHTKQDSFSEWLGTNTFAANGAPDNINSMLITPFNEILIAGEESIEQYERYPGGTVPFFRRWSSGDGISEPYSLCFADNAAWGLNNRHEFVRLSGQTSQSVSDDIQKAIEDKYCICEIGTVANAWAAPCYIKGQKFIVFQSPEAKNSYNTKGFTAVFDIRRGQWFEIFGFDSKNGVPDIWPGRSIFNIWGKTFVGGLGKIYELDPRTYTNDGFPQRVYMRTAHFDSLGPAEISGVRATIKRGVGTYTQAPKVMFRSNPDNKGFGLLQMRDLGLTGQGEMIIEFGAQGVANTWQFEFFMTDDSPFELRRLQVEVTQVQD